jgi:iron(III) transport system ATP-binding protein
MAEISITGLNKYFGDNHVLKDISLDVADKEFVTFLGPSGCGKTTTLRILAGFLTPESGEVTVDGKLLSSPHTTVPPERRKMGMVFQNYAVWPHMSVYENVAFGLKLTEQKLNKAEIRERVARIVAAMGLDGLEHRHPGQLSGGQQQRVALARSLVTEPSILLLDEPLSNLDAKLRERMRTELKDLQRRTGITFIYVTHDQAEAMALSDRIAVFHQGVLQQYGRPREVYEQPANLFVADFMGLVNKVPTTVIDQADGQGRVRLGEDQTLVVTVPPGAAGVREALVAIRPEAIRLSVEPGDGCAGNCLRGTVADSTFLGNIVDYQIDVGGVQLRAQADRHTFFDIGTPVHLTIAVRECVVMRAEEAVPGANEAVADRDDTRQPEQVVMRS